MVDQADDAEVEVEAEVACAFCGHGESEHEDEELEVAGDTMRRSYCRACEAWHELIPAADWTDRIEP